MADISLTQWDALLESSQKIRYLEQCLPDLQSATAANLLLKQDTLGNTPLHYLMQQDYYHRLLMSMLKKINKKDRLQQLTRAFALQNNRHQTALHLLVERSFCASFCKNYGEAITSDILRLTNNEDKTALAIALQDYPYNFEPLFRVAVTTDKKAAEWAILLKNSSPEILQQVIPNITRRATEGEAKLFFHLLKMHQYLYQRLAKQEDKAFAQRLDDFFIILKTLPDSVDPSETLKQHLKEALPFRGVFSQTHRRYRAELKELVTDKEHVDKAIEAYRDFLKDRQTDANTAEGKLTQKLQDKFNDSSEKNGG